ncbi:pilus assembly protein [Erysipelotrichaceae bacterium OH741_COT-311]|nr:pilus assembly protein [Erysipelotrichaceae bacterium OH741_COT-311]
MEYLIVAGIGILVYYVIYTFLAEFKSGSMNTKVRVKRLMRMRDVSDINNEKNRARLEEESIFSFIRVSAELKRLLIASGIRLKPEEFIVFWFVVMMLLPLLAFIIYGNLFFTLAALVIGIIIPPLIINMARKKRMKKFADQLNDALLIIGNSLRTGFTFRHSLARVTEDLPNPIAEEFRRVVREINYGAKLEDSLGACAERMNSRELAMINSAVIIQQRTGGNLADIIDRVNETITERIKLKNSIRVMTSQGRASGVIIGLLPIGLVFLVSLIRADYMATLFTTRIGNILLMIAVVLEVIGFIVIRKMVNIKQ